MAMLSFTLRAIASQTHPEMCLRSLLGDSKTNQADSEDNHQSIMFTFALFYFSNITDVWEEEKEELNGSLLNRLEQLPSDLMKHDDFISP